MIDRSQRRQTIHDVTASAKRAHGQSAADDLAETRQVGLDTETFLRPAPGKTKAGHHFIENQQRAVVCRDFSQEFKVARLGQIQTGVARHRFDDDAGDLSLVGFKRGFDGVGVVERHDNGVLRERRRHARAIRMTKGQRAGAGLDQQRIGMPVVAAVELDYFVALRESARETNGGHARFRAGVAHADLPHARHR